MRVSRYTLLPSTVNMFLFTTGETVALVSVNGPLDIKMQSQSIEKSTLEVIYSSKCGKTSVSHR